jgi:hypothetical protein
MEKLNVDELKAKIISKPYKPFTIDDLPVFMNMEKELLPNEEFKQHPEYSVEVSNMGRVRMNNKILLQRPDHTKSDPYGYLWVNIPNIDDWERYVYRLVAKTWCKRPDKDIYFIVHHITNNGMDNHKENLLWVSCEQHRDIHGFGCFKYKRKCNKDCKYFNEREESLKGNSDPEKAGTLIVEDMDEAFSYFEEFLGNKEELTQNEINAFLEGAKSQIYDWKNYKENDLVKEKVELMKLIWPEYMKNMKN